MFLKFTFLFHYLRFSRKDFINEINKEKIKLEEL